MRPYTGVFRFRITHPDNGTRWGIGAVTLERRDDDHAARSIHDFVAGLIAWLSRDPAYDGATIDHLSGAMSGVKPQTATVYWEDDPRAVLIRPPQ